MSSHIHRSHHVFLISYSHDTIISTLIFLCYIKTVLDCRFVPTEPEKWNVLLFAAPLTYVPSVTHSSNSVQAAVALSADGCFCTGLVLAVAQRRPGQWTAEKTPLIFHPSSPPPAIWLRGGHTARRRGPVWGDITGSRAPRHMDKSLSLVFRYLTSTH